MVHESLASRECRGCTWVIFHAVVVVVGVRVRTVREKIHVKILESIIIQVVEASAKRGVWVRMKLTRRIDGCLDRDITVDLEDWRVGSDERTTGIRGLIYVPEEVAKFRLKSACHNLGKI